MNMFLNWILIYIPSKNLFSILKMSGKTSDKTSDEMSLEQVSTVDHEAILSDTVMDINRALSDYISEEAIQVGEHLHYNDIERFIKFILSKRATPR